ncbi:putative multiple-sugar transport system permease YteP [Paenibacillus allorhizoplanae]|uniref:Multiple-sugar transport system permease YteP n=1 Tax=Paenibacillus allorhizoplanae TaxID=2905648 RepID=A0ABN8GS21_9BACL|nr:ABC transporter permease subunit [Paenibacillus allorhizoplanae]CAH1216671.1 putative multiple-sugar transport system permease YteP [Paenibacillus allorhizoplanae]
MNPNSEIHTTVLPNQLRKVKAKSRLRWKESLPLVLMLIPGILFYVLFKYLPMGGLVIAFKDYNFTEGILHSPWVGMNNFETLFKQDQSLDIIRNTLVLSGLTIICGFPIPIALAIMLNEARRMWFKRIVQTILYMPHFFSWVIVGGLIISILSIESGIVNNWIKLSGGEPFAFLYNTKSWIAVFISSGVWKEMGFNAIIYLAALTAIDPSLYESANIDGANKWQQIRHVTIPGISTTIVLLLILQLGKVMEIGFDHVYVLQNSLNASVSEVISTYMYRVGLQGGQFSLTAAMGFFESVVGFVLVYSANALARRFGHGLF